MPKNDIQLLKPAALATLSSKILAMLPGTAPNAYGVPMEQKTALQNALTSLTAQNAAVETAEAAYHAAIQARQTSRTVCAAAAATIARTVYANPAATPSMIAAMGLSPHSTTRTRVVPITPIKLTATPLPNGSVRLEWDRYGNPPGVNFIVETKTPGGEWRYLQGTTACRLNVSPITPGAAMTFRVSASKNDVTSAPSTPTTVFASSPAPALRVAA